MTRALNGHVFIIGTLVLPHERPNQTNKFLTTDVRMLHTSMTFISAVEAFVKSNFCLRMWRTLIDDEMLSY